MGWQFKEAAQALETYYSGRKEWEALPERKAAYEAEYGQKTKKLKELEKRKTDLEKQKSELAGYIAKDLDAERKAIELSFARKTEANDADYSERKTELNAKYQQDIAANDQLLAQKSQSLLGDTASGSAQLSEYEKSAVEFERSRRAYNSDAAWKVNDCEDKISQESVEQAEAARVCSEQQAAIHGRYDSQINQKSQLIDKINHKHNPIIEACERALSEKIEDRDAEIEIIGNENNFMINQANQTINALREEYEALDKKLTREIKEKQRENKATARLESGRISKLEKINEKITKEREKALKAQEKNNFKASQVRQKYEKPIAKAQEELDQANAAKENELSGPTSEYQSLSINRDIELGTADADYKERVAASADRVQAYTEEIQRIKTECANNLQELDRRMTEYAMSGNTSFGETLNSDYQPFVNLGAKTGTWSGLLDSVKGKKPEKIQSWVDQEYQSQKEKLQAMPYEELMTQVAEAESYDGTLNSLAANWEKVILGSGIAAGVSLALTAGIFMAGGTLYILFALLAAGAAVLLIVAGKKRNETISMLCKYMALAYEYRGFSGLTAHSTQVTEAKELAKMKELGFVLFDKMFGLEEAQKYHKAKADDLKADYERDLQLLTAQYNEKVSELRRQQFSSVQELELQVARENSAHEESASNVAEGIEKTEKEMAALHSALEELKENIEMSDEMVSVYEENYRELENYLNKREWATSTDMTHGVLDNRLYVVSDNAEADSTGHKPIDLITHNKKPLVITYDTEQAAEQEGSFTEALGKQITYILQDLMISVHRMNSQDTYEQMIVDGIAGGNAFKNQGVVNFFHIKTACRLINEAASYLKQLEDFRNHLAGQGTTIDKLNEKNVKSQSRPQPYTILYLVMGPDEKSGKLHDGIERLIPDCDKYGFLPIFICSKQMWEQEKNNSGTVYYEISRRLENKVVHYKDYRFITEE